MMGRLESFFKRKPLTEEPPASRGTNRDELSPFNNGSRIHASVSGGRNSGSRPEHGFTGYRPEYGFTGFTDLKPIRKSVLFFTRCQWLRHHISFYA